MDGQIVFYNNEKEAGAIVTNDKQRFIFHIQDWQEVQHPEIGMVVDFEIDENNLPRRVRLAKNTYNSRRTMQGQIIFYNEQKEAGTIISDDGQRLIFYAQDWQDVVSPERGMKVAFEIDANNRPHRVQLAFAEPISQVDAARAYQTPHVVQSKFPDSQVISRMQQSRHEDDFAAISLWNPMAIWRWSFLFTPIFGAWLCAKNWRALGNQEKAKKSMYWVYAGIVIDVLVLFLPDQVGRLSGIGFLFAWFIFSSMWQQVKYVKEKLNNIYVKKKWGKPMGIAFAAMCAVITVGIVVEFISTDFGAPSTSQADHPASSSQESIPQKQADAPSKIIPPEITLSQNAKTNKNPALEELEDMDVGYDLKWRDVLKNSEIYITRCTHASVQAAMEFGGETEQEATGQMTDICTSELKNLKNCMEGDSPSAEKCLPDKDGGD